MDIVKVAGIQFQANIDKEAKKRAEKEAEEAKEQAKKEAEEAKEQAKKEAEKAEKRAEKKAEKVKEQANKEAEEAERAAVEQAKREAEEARKVEEAKKQAEKEAEEAEKVVRDTRSEIYEGNFQLVVPLPAGFEQVKHFKECLEQIESLRIVWTGGSVDEGAIIAVSAQKPMALIRILNEMPMVEKVDKMGEQIVVVLKPPTIS